MANYTRTSAVSVGVVASASFGLSRMIKVKAITAQYRNIIKKVSQYRRIETTTD